MFLMVPIGSIQRVKIIVKSLNSTLPFCSGAISELAKLFT